VSRTSRRAVVALASAAAVVAVALPASQSLASDPESSALTVPTTPGEAASAEFTGTAPIGAQGTVTSCDGGPTDEHTLELTVPEGVYERLTATITFDIRWDPAATTNDLVLEVYDGAGEEIGRSDGGSPAETVTLENLEGGTYTALICGFANETPQAYDGSIVIATKALPGPVPPTVERGLEFSASLVTDPQRSQGEAAAFADDQGVLYSCGTNGASNGTDHGSVSVDGGETWRPLGTGPIGETGTAQGGGDCAIGTGQDPNEDGNRQLAFIGLGPLTGFSTFSSPDNGRTLQRSPDQNGLEKFNQQSLVDRQWLAFTDAQTVFLNYNGFANVGGGFVEQQVQKSTDGGITYGPQQTVATDGNRIGQIRAIREGVVPGVDPTKDVVYFPYNSGNLVKLAMSLDGGETFSQCLAVDAEIDPTAGFVAADHDSAGNIYVTYSEKGGGRDTYLVALKADKVQNCKGPNPVEQSADNNVDPGFTEKIRINREGIETTVMPWVAAGGAPGRVAVSYYGTPSEGDPDNGEFKATWHVYVNQTLDAFAEEPEVDQAQATTHPNHYDSICLNGLACSVENGDRSLVDYFTMAYDPVSGRLLVVYNQAAKRPGDASGRIAAPVALVQRAGPSNGGDDKVVSGSEVVRTRTGDKAADALPRWTTGDGLFGSPTTRLPGGDNQPALDLLNVSVEPEVDLETGERVEDGGFTVTMTYDDLSPAALNAALVSGQGGSLVYLFRFFDGFQPGGAMAYYEPTRGGWRFGATDYQITEGRNPQGNVETYEPEVRIPGAVDVDAGTIRLSVPRAQIEALAPPTGEDPRPTEVEATQGSRIYDASAWTFVNTLTSNDEQSFLMQSDNTAAFDFLLGAEPDPLVAKAREIFDACPQDRVPRDSRQDDNGNTHEFAIDCMVWYEIAQGTSSTQYEPSKAVTRAQMASFVARLIEKSGGELEQNPPDAFSDDNGLEPHEANINKLAAAGIVAGKGDGTYDPEGPVTRAQMAKFLVEGYEFRSENALTSDGDYFADDEGSVHEANINKSATAGFTSGRNGGYDPGASVLRDQMASFLSRVLDLLVEEGTTPVKQ
jgi:hypothetical protein